MAREGTNSAESKIAEVISNLPETVFLVSESGEILATSQVAEETFGYTKSQLLGANYPTFSLPNHSILYRSQSSVQSRIQTVSRHKVTLPSKQ